MTPGTFFCFLLNAGTNGFHFCFSFSCPNPAARRDRNLLSDSTEINSILTGPFGLPGFLLFYILISLDSRGLSTTDRPGKGKSRYMRRKTPGYLFFIRFLRLAKSQKCKRNLQELRFTVISQMPHMTRGHRNLFSSQFWLEYIDGGVSGSGVLFWFCFVKVKYKLKVRRHRVTGAAAPLMPYIVHAPISFCPGAQNTSQAISRPIPRCVVLPGYFYALLNDKSLDVRVGLLSWGPARFILLLSLGPYPIIFTSFAVPWAGGSVSRLQGTIFPPTVLSGPHGSHQKTNALKNTLPYKPYHLQSASDRDEEMDGIKTASYTPLKPRYAAEKDSTHAEAIRMVTGVFSEDFILFLILYRLINSAEAVERIEGNEFFNLSFLGTSSPGLRLFLPGGTNGKYAALHTKIYGVIHANNTK